MTSAALWPWLTLIGLGLYHGANPAMGWLFAVALGLQRGSERVVLLSVLPIALGHAAAVAAVLFGVLTLGLFIDRVVLIRLMGIALFGWAFWLALYGHRHPVRIGMQTGLLGLVLWSFLMASGHGAGLMLIPALAPICGSYRPMRRCRRRSPRSAYIPRRCCWRSRPSRSPSIYGSASIFCDADGLISISFGCLPLAYAAWFCW
jgi:NADH:ubiquinone oxidoreductase subunit K